ESPEPREITENYWRFQFTLPSKKTTSFVVKQKQLLYQQHGLSDIQDQQLTFWLEQKYVDAKLAKALRAVLDLRQQAASQEEAIAKLERERTKIHEEQKRIRENLQSLGDRASEKELRERFVRTLNSQEDRLEKIDQELQARHADLDDCRE